MAAQPQELRKAAASNNKKGRNPSNFTASSPRLPDLSMPNPKYITLSTTNAEKPISCYSCFAVHRAIKLISPEVVSISTQCNGSLLLLVRNSVIANKFLEAKELLGVCEISCELPEAMNCVRGTIYAPYLVNVPEAEILAELGAQHVTAVYKYGTMINGVLRHTGKILLTFDLHTLPSSINVVWNTVRVMPYIPFPMRCKNCQLLGHSTKHCLRRSACSVCNLPPHAPQGCIRVQCANCKQGHPSSSAACNKYQEQKEVLQIKFRKRCSMREARLIYRRQLVLASTVAIPNTSGRSTYKPVEKRVFDSYSGRASDPHPNTANSSSSYTPNSLYTSPDSRNAGDARENPNSYLPSSISDDGMRDSYI